MTLESTLACPRCHGEITLGESILCEACGSVGTTTLGFADFLADQDSLPLAAGGSFDLAKDREMAIELARSADSLSYEQLRAKAEEQRPPGTIRDTRGPSSALADRARRRYERKYVEVEREVNIRAGESDLSKAGAYLHHVGGPALSGGLAVEAGGGHGLHLPAFAKRFDRVIMVDCSLNLMVLARRLCSELGLANVFFVRANVESLPLRAGSARFVHSNGVIEHAADPAAMIAEADRVLASPGAYVCVSPNRFPITPEPHFAIPLFGVFPRSLRRRVLLPLLRGVDDEAGTDLLSLAELRRELAAVGERREIFFLPPRLERTVRNTGSRRALVRLMSSPAGRRVTLFVANRLLLPIAPYQMGVAIKDSEEELEPVAAAGAEL